METIAEMVALLDGGEDQEDGAAAASWVPHDAEHEPDLAFELVALPRSEEEATRDPAGDEDESMSWRGFDLVSTKVGGVTECGYCLFPDDPQPRFGAFKLPSTQVQPSPTCVAAAPLGLLRPSGGTPRKLVG